MEKLMEKCKAAVVAFPEIELAYWFGSRAKGKGTPLSDWDFEPPLEAVYFSVPGAPPTIGLSNRLLRDPTLFRCVLAEEIGHHFTTVGDALPKTYFHYAQGLTVSRAEYRAWR